MTPKYVWLNGVVGQFIEGAADGFIVTAGGSSIAQALMKSPGLTLAQIGISMGLAGCLYAASFLKNNPTPFTTVTTVAAKDIPIPSSEAPPKVVPSVPVVAAEPVTTTPTHV